jgi:outer membrane protein assembly factor BamE (lipoprotein component of BamABCDE complex)
MKSFTVKPAVLLFCICLLSGYQSFSDTKKVPAHAFSQIQQGISKDRLIEILGSDGKPQFTVKTNSHIYFCVSYSFEKPFIRYYFLFEDETLRSILEPPAFEVETVPYKGAKLEIRKPVNPEERMNSVLNASSLTVEEFKKSLTQKLSVKSENSNVLPAFIITAPLLGARRIIDSPELNKDYEKNDELTKRFDSRKIGLGSSKEQVQSAFGKPQKTVSYFGKEAEVFNAKPPAKVLREDRFSPVLVVFEKDKVIRIFSNDFFPQNNSGDYNGINQ